MFMGLLIIILNGSSHTKYKLLSNQKCMTQSTATNSYPIEYSQEFQYYPFAVKQIRQMCWKSWYS